MQKWKWNPADSVLKVKTLEIFVQYDELRPTEWAELVGFTPVRAAYSYLKRLRRQGLLRRKRNVAGRVVYRIGSNGARYLLWWNANFGNARVQP